MILVDSNIPMYVLGADHPHKNQAKLALERSIAEGDLLVTDAEVLQEILHRYVAIGRREAIEPAFELLLGVVDEVYPIQRDDVSRAKGILLSTDRLSARDSIHLAVMFNRGIERVLSFDRGLDGIPGVTRIAE